MNVKIKKRVIKSLNVINTIFFTKYIKFLPLPINQSVEPWGPHTRSVNSLSIFLSVLSPG